MSTYVGILSSSGTLPFPPEVLCDKIILQMFFLESTTKSSRTPLGNSLGFMINDDRFILGSLENWEFGVDNTGDLMEPANLEQLVARCRQLGDVHLLTADGSIDCQVGSRELYSAYIFPSWTSRLILAAQGAPPG